MAASPLGRELAGRVAARSDAGVVSGVTEIRPGPEGWAVVRPIFGGRATQEVLIPGPRAVIAIRPHSSPRPRWERRGPGMRAPGGAFRSGTRSIRRRRIEIRPRSGCGAEPLDGLDRRERGSGVALGGEFPPRRGPREDPGGGRRCLARGDRCRVAPHLLPGRPDRPVGLAAALHRRRDLGGDPAPDGNDELAGDRRDQLRRPGPDLPGRGLRDLGGPVRHPPALTKEIARVRSR